MKTTAIALIATAAYAQSTAAEALADQQPAASTTAIPAGAGVNGLTTQTGSIVTSITPGVSGTVTITQVTDYPAPSQFNIVQTWTMLTGLADDGSNVYQISNGQYGTPVTKAATISTSKRCGTAADMKPVGANSLSASLSSSGCSLSTSATYTQSATTFTQTMALGLVPTATSGSLVLGG